MAGCIWLRLSLCADRIHLLAAAAMTLLLMLAALVLLRYALQIARYFRNWPTGSPDYGYGEVDIDNIRQMEAR